MPVRTARGADALSRRAQPLRALASFANVELLALVLHQAFGRVRPLFVENAVVGMHVVSIVLVSSLPLVPVVRVMAVSHTAGLIWILTIFTWQFLYLAAAVRRYYFTASSPARPRLKAAIAALAIDVVNSAFVTAVQMVGGAIAVRSL